MNGKKGRGGKGENVHKKPGEEQLRAQIQTRDPSPLPSKKKKKKLNKNEENLTLGKSNCLEVPTSLVRLRKKSAAILNSQ